MRAAIALFLGWFVVGCSGAVGGIMDEAPQPASEPPPGEEDASTPEDDAGPSRGDDTGTTPSDSGAPSDTGAPPEDTAAPPGDPPVSGLSLVPDLAIQEVAVFQAVKVSVARDGAKVSTRNADVIAGREALVRVYVTPKAAWSAREVIGELKLESAKGPTTFTATLTPTAASTDAALSSTFNFQVPADVLAVDTKYSVSLYAKSGSTGGDTSGARHPASGLETLDARSTGDALKVVIVPVRYDADGSGRLPDVSAEQLERYRRAFHAMYPARKVEVTARAPFGYAGAVSPNGSGFSSLLQAVVKLRQADGAPKNVYYYGAFAGRATFSQWCGSGCVTGLCGLLTYPSDSVGRACVGVGYTGAQSANTAAHEIGHAHGRGHAPCGGVSQYDSKYPHSGGRIGAWGYSVIDKKLIDPNVGKDFMSYCSPEWVSDYTFKALTDRMAFVNGASSFFAASSGPLKYRFVDVGFDGRLSWGDTITLNEPPTAEEHTLTYEAPDGRIVGKATGHYYPYDDMPGGYLLVPEPTTEITMTVAGLPTTVESRLRFKP